MKIIETESREDAKKRFYIGDRVQLSDLGLRRMKHSRHGRIGEVVGFGRPTAAVRIAFDGRSCPATLHGSYLKRK